MGSNPEAGLVAGVFADEEHATDAVHKLIEAHYDPHHEINVIAAHKREHQNVPIWEKFNFKRNAPLGALIGALIGGVGAALAGLTIGPFTMVAAGPFFAALEVAFGGGCAGFAIGALMSLEDPDQRPIFENVDIHDGVVWVGVQAKGERGERARHILAAAGARHFTS